MNYIMKEEMFNQLSFVTGFNRLNGDTYQQHITIIFKDKLNENQKNTILNQVSGKDALKILNQFNINYTHKYSDN